MNADTTGLLKEALAWLREDCPESEALERIEKAISSGESDKFRAVFAGGVSRGKTRLLNSLLDADIFPESSIPTTTLLTEVVYGEKPELILESAGKARELPLASGILERFSAGGEDEDMPAMLRAKYPARFLKHGLALYDTPGSDDALARRADVSFRALELADGAVIAIAANSPVSLLEKSYIDICANTHILPKIAVVITFLDSIKPSESARQIEYIAQRVHALNPDIEIWSATATPAALCAISGPEAIRARLVEWREDPALAKLRSRKTLGAASIALEAALADLSEALALIEAQKEKAGRDYKIASENLDGERREWEAMRESFQASASAAANDIEAKLAQIQAGLLASLADGGDPEFRAQLRSRLAQGARDLIAAMHARLNEDASGLKRTIGAKFSAANLAGLEPRPDFAIGYVLPDLPERGPDDIVAILIGFARSFWRDLGPLIPAPPMLRGRLQKLVDSGLASLASAAGGGSQDPRQAIGQFFAGLKDQLVQALRRVYMEIADNAREEQDRWLARQRDLVAGLRDPDRINEKLADLRARQESGNALLASLRAAISELDVNRD